MVVDIQEQEKETINLWWSGVEATFYSILKETEGSQIFGNHDHQKQLCSVH